MRIAIDLVIERPKDYPELWQVTASFEHPEKGRVQSETLLAPIRLHAIGAALRSIGGAIEEMT